MSKRTLPRTAAGGPVRVLASTAIGAALIVTLAAGAQAAGAQARAGTVTNFKFGLNAVGVLSPTSAWAVGDSATVLHWDGISWAPVTIPGLPADIALNTVDAVSSSDVWAAGEADSGQPFAPSNTLIVHWDGTAWARVSSPGPSASNLFPTLRSLSMDSATDGWAVGSVYDNHTNTSSNLALHWNGTSWQRVAASPAAGFSGVASFSPLNATAVGDEETASHVFKPEAFHWNGTSWAQAAALPPPHGVSGAQLGGLDGLSAPSATEMWTVGSYFTSTGVKDLAWHWNGTRWTVLSTSPVGPSGSGLTGVAATGAASVWAVGYTSTSGAFGNDQAPVSVHRNSTSWTSVTTPDPIGPNNGSAVLNGVSNAGPGTVWAVGSYARNEPGGLGNPHTFILRWNGTHWIRT